jgi:hypothetical protein
MVRTLVAAGLGALLTFAAAACGDDDNFESDDAIQQDVEQLGDEIEEELDGVTDEES